MAIEWYSTTNAISKKQIVLILLLMEYGHRVIKLLLKC